MVLPAEVGNGVDVGKTLGDMAVDMLKCGQVLVSELGVSQRIEGNLADGLPTGIRVGGAGRAEVGAARQSYHRYQHHGGAKCIAAYSFQHSELLAEERQAH